MLYMFSFFCICMTTTHRLSRLSRLFELRLEGGCPCYQRFFMNCHRYFYSVVEGLWVWRASVGLFNALRPCSPSFISHVVFVSGQQQHELQISEHQLGFMFNVQSTRRSSAARVGGLQIYHNIRHYLRESPYCHKVAPETLLWAFPAHDCWSRSICKRMITHRCPFALNSNAAPPQGSLYLLEHALTYACVCHRGTIF